MKRVKLRPVLCLLMAILLLLASCTPNDETGTPGPSGSDPQPSNPGPSAAPEIPNRENIHFSDLPYHLPTAEEITNILQQFVADMDAAESAEEQIRLIIENERALCVYTDMASIARIRFSQNVTDETQAESQHFSNLFASVLADDHEADKAVVNSKYIDELEAYFGKEIIDQYRKAVREYDPAQAELLRTLSELSNRYTQLEVEYDPDIFYTGVNALYDEMLPLREEVAALSGYGSFREYSFSNWSISLSEVEQYIRDVKQTILPVYQKMADSVPEGESRCPAGDWIWYPFLEEENPDINARAYEIAVQMLRSALPETNPMLDYMEHNGLIDVMPRERKEQGAFTMPLYGARVPFVFALLPEPEWVIHEFGHAFEVFEWPDVDTTSRFSMTPETAEVSSECMGVLATERYELLFGDTADYARMKKIYDLAESVLQTLLFCEFELEMYKNPNFTRAERDKVFKNLLDEYRVEGDFSWMYISHFFTSPLYTVSYSLDSVVALELWQLLQENPSKAKQSYLRYVRNSTQQDFTARLQDAGMGNPLERRNLETLAVFLDDLFTSDGYWEPQALGLAG
ncbi:MAG: hypothetical protein FWG31_10240 [Oscillospiraceae bacterium]|nr:hypothetical protein [Oscillospiraceae bacterium]